MNLNFIPQTPAEQQAMLASLGLNRMEELLRSIPEAVRLKRELRLPGPLSEQELRRELAVLAQENWDVERYPCFLGAGAYDHFLPSAVRQLAADPAFLTAYTPYQAEINQGILQAIYEFQTLVCQLTEMEVANASLYDGATALVEAARMALAARPGRRRLLVARSVHPEYQAVLRASLPEVELESLPYLPPPPAGEEAEGAGEGSGQVDPARLQELCTPEVAGVLVQTPNFFGCLENLETITACAHAAGALAVAVVNPLSLGIISAPGEVGVDIVVGEGQPLGNPLSFGGPYLGLLACRQEYLRRLPGRVVGATVDQAGRRGFVLTLQTREQHIRRERATSNICSNEALNALTAAIYLALLGPQGLREVGELCWHKAHYTYRQLLEAGFRPVFGAPFWHEFAVRSPISAEDLAGRLQEAGMIGGYSLARFYPELGVDTVLFCVTEKRTAAEIARLIEVCQEVGRERGWGGTAANRSEGWGADGRAGQRANRDTETGIDIAPGVGAGGGGGTGTSASAGANEDKDKGTKTPPDQGSVTSSGEEETWSGEPLLWELSVPGRQGFSFAPLDVPPTPLLLPPWARRRRLPPLPELGEIQVVRHFVRLARRSHGVDTGFYPLGSCTMKYNPRVNEEVAAWPGLRDLHPYQPVQTVQGALRLMAELQAVLAEIAGMEAVSLAPAAGAHGEMAGMLMVRAYHHARGEEARRKVLVPDSAHGTNPASAALAGFTVVTVPSNPRGQVDLAALRRLADGETAALMLTNPNTLGLFESQILEIAAIVHGVGGLLYYDGANMNAILGIARPGDMGFDLVHFNLHKTFATPHGGGGPGAGPIGASRELAPFLPVPLVERTEDGHYRLVGAEDRPRTIGQIKAFAGNFGVLVRAYAYLRALGAAGLRRVSETAVLNANYLLAKLSRDYEVPYPGPCLHEFVLSCRKQREKGVRALDIAKRLLDFGIHPPTIYFPLIVEEAMMIEPTETETRQTLDAFAAVMARLAHEAEAEPERLRSAPHLTPVGRLDEVLAARQPNLRWQG